MKRAALYMRVSTEEQSKYGYSLDSQLEALKEYCSKHDMEIPDGCIYCDAGISGYKSYKRRKEINRLIVDSQEGKFDVILFTKLDRWFRSIKDYYKVMDQIPDNISWNAIWEDYETETSSGRFKVNIMLSIAQAESERTSERIKAVNDYKKSTNQFIPFKLAKGYMVEDKTIRHNRKVIKDPEWEKTINDLFQTYLTTFSLTAACKTTIENGHRISKVQICRTLKNVIYAGDMFGIQVDPYITMEQHNLILENMAKTERTPKNPDRVYIFSGLLYCGKCGTRLSSKCRTYTRKDGTVNDIKFYICNSNRQMSNDCSGSYANEKYIEQYLLSSFDNIFNNYLLSLTDVKNEQMENEKKIAALKAKLERIGERYEDGDIDRDTYRSKRESINLEIKKLSVPAVTNLNLSLPDNWKDLYEALDDTNKRAFWKSYIAKIVVNTGSEPIIYF